MFCGSQRGFSLPELMLTVATAATIMALSVPVLLDVSESTKLNGATREVERELQSARLKAVSANRSLRVRFNCPEAGYYRTVEVIGQAIIDNSTNRCSTTAYPVSPDNDRGTRPNHDGPVRILPNGATVTTDVIEFRPDGTARQVVANTPVTIATPLTLTVTRNQKSKTVTVNGAGKIELQLQ